LSLRNIPKVGIFSLSSCEGCIVEILALEEEFLDILSMIHVSDCRVLGIKDEDGEIDVAFVEGAVMSPWDEAKIKKIRERSKILVAIGDCAVSGGRYMFRDFGLEEIDKKLPRMGKYKAHPLSKYVKVDYCVPGCPIIKEEFKRLLKDILIKRKPLIPHNDVCSECPRYYNCLIDEGKPCLGPITMGGCGAYCPSRSRECVGCRGLYEDANVKALIEVFRKKGIRIPTHLVKLLEVSQSE